MKTEEILETIIHLIGVGDQGIGSFLKTSVTITELIASQGQTNVKY